jgi:uroporphyrinogen decarboxylase
MVDRSGTKEFRYAKSMLFSDPAMAHRLLEKLARAVSEYLKAQVRAGADIVQIFDTWGGVLGRQAFEEFSLRYIRQIVEEVRSLGVPVIVFGKGCGHSLAKIAATGADVVGLDWTEDVGMARAVVGERVALQGNMDPVMLFAPPERIVSEVGNILASYGRGHGHIFNLGHGILPETPVEHVKAFVEAVKMQSPAFHDRREGV